MFQHNILNSNCIGYLYPDRDRELTEADSFEKLKDACKGFDYERMLSQVSDVPSRDKGGDFGGAREGYSANMSIGILIY